MVLPACHRPDWPCTQATCLLTSLVPIPLPLSSFCPLTLHKTKREAVGELITCCDVTQPQVYVATRKVALKESQGRLEAKCSKAVSLQPLAQHTQGWSTYSLWNITAYVVTLRHCHYMPTHCLPDIIAHEKFPRPSPSKFACWKWSKLEVVKVWECG